MCADAPDTSGMNKAAEANAAISKEALDFYRQVYADTAGQRTAASSVALEQAGLQTEAARKQIALADQTNNRIRTVQQPLEDQIIRDAQGYNTEARREEAAGRAVGDVAQAFDNTRGQLERQLTRSGVDPSSGRALSMTTRLAADQALASAGAANKARVTTEAMGAAKLADAASMLRGLPSNQSTQLAGGVSAGNSGVANAAAPLGIANQGAALMDTGYRTAISGNGSAGQMFGQAAQIDAQASSSGLAGIINLAKAGSEIYRMSDKTKKKDRKPVKSDAALAAARKLPVETWKYKKGAGMNDGEQTHIGPMAQDAQKAGGDGLAPGGKVINMQNMVGLTLASVQALDKKVAALSKQVAKDTRRDIKEGA